MKVFAFILAALLSFQVTSPLLCMTSCDMMATSNSTEESSSACEIRSGCCSSKKNSSCEMSLKESDGKTSADTKQPEETKNCCTPCCAGPLCTCYCEECEVINFTPQPVQLAGQLPSSNGTPIEGYIADCWQPPETFKI